MLPDALVMEIQRRLASGQSQRSVARLLSVSRGTVSAVANGRRTTGQGSCNPKETYVPPHGPIARCPECGAKVMMPCLACQVRQIRRDRRHAAGGSWKANNPMVAEPLPRSEARELSPESTPIPLGRLTVLVPDHLCRSPRQPAEVQSRTPWPNRQE